MINNDNAKKICFVVETKNKEEKDLSDEEKVKIKMAEKFFNEKIKIIFKKQLKGQTIYNILNNLII